MKKLLLASIIVASTQLTGCSGISTDPSYETVLVDKPWFFGHGGVRNETQKPGLSWYALSTSGIAVPTYAFKIDEPFDDLPTQRQSLVDFNSYLKIKINDPVMMVSKFRYDGKSMWWYESSIKEQYRTIVRNVSRNYTMEDMLTNSAKVDEMEKEIRVQMDKLIKEIGLPIELTDLSLGAIRPNKSVMDEIDNTSVQQQRIKTEQSRKAAEDSRKDAENARASADKAYQTQLGLTPDDVVKLQIAKMYSDACQKSQTCIMGAVNPVVPVK